MVVTMRSAIFELTPKTKTGKYFFFYCLIGIPIYKIFFAPQLPNFIYCSFFILHFLSLAEMLILSTYGYKMWFKDNPFNVNFGSFNNLSYRIKENLIIQHDIPH